MVEKTEIHAIVTGLLAALLVLAGGCGNGQRQRPAVEPAPEAATESPLEEPPLAQEPVPADDRAEGPGIPLKMKFILGQTTGYKVTTETEKSIRWEGDASKKPKEFKGGATGNRIEMGFDQEVLEVKDNGDALIRVTIKTLAYVGRVRGAVVLAFDSSNDQDRQNPMAKLIGQSYTIRMTPRGAISDPVQAEPARQAVQGGEREHRTALKLLADRVVKERHEVTALAALKAPTARCRDQWSNIERFSFGILGEKVYERVYTLDKISETDEARTAVVRMKGIPSAAMAEELHQAQTANPFAAMSDSSGTYNGRLELNLDTGQIGEYIEQMDMQWLLADPVAVQRGDPAPAVLRMISKQLYKLERTD